MSPQTQPFSHPSIPVNEPTPPEPFEIVDNIETRFVPDQSLMRQNSSKSSSKRSLRKEKSISATSVAPSEYEDICEPISTTNCTSSIATDTPPSVAPPEPVPSSFDGLASFLKKILNKDVDSLRLSIPLFFLEPISGLEFISDVGRIDDFANAPLLHTPFERMLATVRIFLAGLSRMHSRRNCKKPFNPVLGETLFTCYEPVVPSSSVESNSSTLAKNSGNNSSRVFTLASSATSDAVSIKSASSSATACEIPPRVYLVGEQVSHHPPISAFHMTCPERRIDTTMSFYLAAKFNGISFQLTNRSYVELRMPDHGEIYLVTYPDAVVAGILTMSPRFLWCGKCSITCAQSGLTTKIAFKNQSFLGRDTHDLTGTIEDTSHGGAILAKLSGAWNAEVSIRHTAISPSAPTNSGSASSLSPPEVLFKYDEPSAYVATTDPRSTCRTIWGGVAAAMRSGDTNTAKKLKSDIESSQRTLERSRISGAEPQHVPQFFAFRANNACGASSSSGSSTSHSTTDLLSGRWEYIGPSIPQPKCQETD